MNATLQRIRAEALDRKVKLQHRDVQIAFGKLQKAAEMLIAVASWGFDGDEDPAYQANRAIEYAHELVDLGYEFRDAVRANAIVKEPDDEA